MVDDHCKTSEFRSLVKRSLEYEPSRYEIDLRAFVENLAVQQATMQGVDPTPPQTRIEEPSGASSGRSAAKPAAPEPAVEPAKRRRRAVLEDSDEEEAEEEAAVADAAPAVQVEEKVVKTEA